MRRFAPLLALFAILLAAPPSLAVASTDSAEEPVFSRTYGSRSFTPFALEALLWDACPDDLAHVECVVARHDGKLGMTAPASVHRAVVRRLAELEARSDSPVRIDLILAEPGAVDSLAALPGEARDLLDGMRSRWNGSGLVHLDSAIVGTLEGSRTNLTAADRSFALETHPRPTPLASSPRRQLRLTHQGPREERDALNGGILDVTIPLPTRPTLVGTTHYRVNGPELIVLVTPQP